MSEDNLEVVSQEMMDELIELRRLSKLNHDYVVPDNPIHTLKRLFEYGVFHNLKCYMSKLPHEDVSGFQMKVLRFVHYGEELFQAEKPNKWIVRSKDNKFHLAELGLSGTFTAYEPDAIKFDTKEDAEAWTNPQCEVVEVEG